MIPWDAAFPVPVCTGIAFLANYIKAVKEFQIGVQLSRMVCAVSWHFMAKERDNPRVLTSGPRIIRPSV